MEEMKSKPVWPVILVVLATTIATYFATTTGALAIVLWIPIVATFVFWLIDNHHNKTIKKNQVAWLEHLYDLIISSGLANTVFYSGIKNWNKGKSNENLVFLLRLLERLEERMFALGGYDEFDKWRDARIQLAASKIAVIQHPPETKDLKATYPIL